MMNGRVLYRDIYEQKGPLLYVLYGFAWIISHDTFMGAYVLELLACSVFLYYSYRTLRLYCGPAVLALLPFWAALLYGSNAFSHGGSAEELCLPIYAYIIYTGLSALKEQREISLTSCFTVGLLAGMVLWIKYSMLGIFAGFVLTPAALLVRKKRWKRLEQSAGLILLGVLLATFPFLAYFGLNHAVKDWMEAYMYNNIFLYSQSEAVHASLLERVITNLWLGLKCMAVNEPAALGLIFLGEVWLFLHERKQIACHFTAMLLCSFGLVFAGGRNYIYYPLILSAFSVLGVAFVGKLAEKRKPESLSRTLMPLCVILGAAFSYLLSSNTYLMKYEKDDLPQYQLGKIICAEDNPTLLHYGSLDAGFYTVCNIVPEVKYFCGLNIPLEEIKEAQVGYVESGLTEFVVAVDTEFDFEMYEFVKEWPFWFEGRERTYYLFRRK